MSKKKSSNKQMPAAAQTSESPAGSHDSVRDTARLMLGGIILAAVVCVVLIAIIVTQKKQPVILPVNVQQQTPADGGPDMYGRTADDEHYGHSHP